MHAADKIEGLRDLRRDLKRIDKDLPREINQSLKRTAEPIRDTAAMLAPHRTGRLAGSIRVGTRGSRLVIYSRHPAARIIHFGGRHPLFGNRDHWYEQKANPFMARALERYQFRVRRDIEATIEREMRRAGFRST